MSHPALTIARDVEDLAARAAGRFLQAAGEAIARDGRFRVALAGGSTPEKLYSLLAQPEEAARVDWDRSFLFLGDERLVPLDDSRSNYALVRRTLLASGRIPAGRVFPVPVQLATANAAAAAYEETLARAFAVENRSRPPRFDLILLGLGDDGHTASLFPHAPALAVTDRWVVGSPPGTLPPPVDRITLTYPVLNAARRVIFLVSGEKKAAVLQELLEGDPSPETRPAAGVRPVDGTVEWLVDEAAASKLSVGSRQWAVGSSEPSHPNAERRTAQRAPDAEGAPTTAHRPLPTRPRLLIADVDGTLVTKDKILTERAQQAVRGLRAAGIAFAITSGRPPRGMSMLIAPLDLTTPIAAFNGGLFVRPDLTLIEQHTLPAEVAARVVPTLEAYGLDIWIYRGSEWYLRRRDAPHVDREEWTVKFPPTVVSSFEGLLDDVVKITGVSDDLEAVARCEAETRRQCGPRVSAARSQPYYLDVTHPDANKGTVVLRLSEFLSIPPAEIATIGDMPNDVLMFAKSGISIAMGNASAEVQRSAHYVTTSYDDEGFANAVERFILT